MSSKNDVGRDDRDAAMRLVVLDRAVLQREERPIAAGADILARMQLGAALPDEDITSDGDLAAKHLDAQPF